MATLDITVDVGQRGVEPSTALQWFRLAGAFWGLIDGYSHDWSKSWSLEDRKFVQEVFEEDGVMYTGSRKGKQNGSPTTSLLREKNHETIKG